MADRKVDPFYFIWSPTKVLPTCITHDFGEAQAWLNDHAQDSDHEFYIMGPLDGARQAKAIDRFAIDYSAGVAARAAAE